MGGHPSELLKPKSRRRQPRLPKELRQKYWKDAGRRDKLWFHKLAAIQNHKGTHFDFQFQFLLKMLPTWAVFLRKRGESSGVF